MGRRAGSSRASAVLPRATIAAFAEALMSAEASTICGAPYGQRSDERVNSRNGWDTRVGTVELAIPGCAPAATFSD